MKKITFFAVLGLTVGLFHGCEKEAAFKAGPTAIQGEKQENTNFSAAFATLPEIEGIQQKMAENRDNKKIAWSSAKNGGKNAVWLDKEKVVKMVDSVGNATYAVRLLTTKRPYNEFYNLVVSERADGKQVPPFVQVYTIDPDYFYTYMQGKRAENGFQGTVGTYSLTTFLGGNTLSVGKLITENPCFIANVYKKRGDTSSGGYAAQEVANESNSNSFSFVPARTTYIHMGTKKTGGKDAYAVEGGKGVFGGNPFNLKQSKSSNKKGILLKGDDCPWNTEMMIPINELKADHVHLEEEAKNPCVKDILDELQRKDLKNLYVVPDVGGLSGTGHLSQGILDLFDKSGDNYEITFKVEEAGKDSNGNHRNASTTGSSDRHGGFKFDITLDDDYVKNATNLAIARTIIHESVHAYLGQVLQKNPVSNTAKLLREYQNKFGDKNVSEHTFMTQFVEAMGYSLSVWDNRNQDKEYYNNLAWSGGMLGTDAYKKLSTKKKNAIEKANIAEGSAIKKANSNAKGIKCK